MSSSATDLLSLFPPRRYLDEVGELVSDEPLPLDDDRLVALLRLMLKARAYDEKCLALQRQGRLAAVYQSSGQEANTAAALALGDEDWLFPAYREPGMLFARGLSVESVMGTFTGNQDDGWDVPGLRIAPIAATIGTHLPHGTGLAYAASLQETGAVALVSFGDGATSEGDFHAALNFGGVWKIPAVFFCNNNQYAQSSPLRIQTAAASLADKAVAYGIPGVRVDGMDALAVYAATAEAVRRARAGEGPTLIEAIMYRFGPHSSYDGEPVYRTREEEAEWRTKDPVVRLTRLLQARGLVDDSLEPEIREETVAEVERALEAMATRPLPSALDVATHVFDRMPRRLAEQVGEPTGGPDLWGIDDDAEPDGERAALTMVQALNQALAITMEERREAVVLGEDVGLEGGIFRVTEGLQERFGDRRVIDTPLCEQGIMGAAVGMALGGLRPVVEIEFAGFTYTAFDQLVGHAARMRWRTRGQVSLPIVVRMPAGGGHGGFEFHSDAPEAYFVHAPGLVVVYPSNAYDAKGLLRAALEGDDPVVFFEPIASYFAPEPGVPLGDYRLPIGRASVKRAGTDLTIVTYGRTVGVSLEAATALEAEGVAAEVVDLRTLYPWDEETVLESVARTRRLLVVQEAPTTAGVGAEVAATVAEKGLYDLDGPVVRLGHPDMPWGPTALEQRSALTPQAVIAAARRTLAS